MNVKPTQMKISKLTNLLLHPVYALVKDLDYLRAITTFTGLTPNQSYHFCILKSVQIITEPKILM